MNMNKYLRLLVLVAMASAQPLLAQGSTSPALNVSQYSNKQIEKIDIVLNRVTPHSSFDPNSIRARMKTKVGGNFSQLILPAAKNCFKRYYVGGIYAYFFIPLLI